MGKSKGQMKSRLSYSAGAFGNDVFYATLSTLSPCCFSSPI